MVAKTEHKNRSGCPLACALDILGDHWSLLIVRNLMFLGLHEYKEMLKEPEQISSSILTNRLKKLEQSGIISSTAHPHSKRRKLYYLTDMGKDLIHVLIDFASWSNKHLGDAVMIPVETKSMLEKNPQLMIELTLEELDVWENKFILNTAGKGNKSRKLRRPP